MRFFFLLLATFLGGVISQVEPPVGNNTTPVPYEDGDQELLGHISMPAGDGPFPAVVIVPDWDGVNEYEQIRATLVTEEWGFVGFAADIYGADNQDVTNMTLRGELADFYRSNPDIFASRIDVAVELVKAMESVDENQVAIFGYCFGGTGVIMYGLEGLDNVNAIVSFHGGLSTLPNATQPVGPNMLVLSGGEDDAASEIMDLEQTLDAANATWEITRYSGIEHAFTKWDDDRYNEWADMRSWYAAGEFILENFGLVELETAVPDEVSVVAVNYTDDIDGMLLSGKLAMPAAGWERPLPAVIVLPDWDGNNEYESQRATALAELGYVAFAADVFGADKEYVEDFAERAELTTFYFNNSDILVSRIQSAIDQVKLLTDDVAPEEIAVIGYCFGGSAAILYSFSEPADAKVAVAFHGSFTDLPPVNADPIVPYLLVLSGGTDILHGNQTTMEEAFDGGSADWEITRYSGAEHGFTKPDDDRYQLRADARSWDSMFSAFQGILAAPLMGDMNTTAPDGDVPSAAPVESATSGAPTMMSDMDTTMAPTTMSDMETPTSMPPTAADMEATVSPTVASGAHCSSFVGTAVAGISFVLASFM